MEAMDCSEIIKLKYEKPVAKDPQMLASMEALETALNYRFKKRNLLEDALTHSSCTGYRSYERLEFVGDSALGLAFSSFLYLTYPDLEPGHLSIIRSANISTEKLARLAIRHNLHRYIRIDSPALEASVETFAYAIQHEDDPVQHGGPIKAPKLLADIVESIAAAIYVDADFDVKALWMVFRGFLEPIATYEDVVEKPQPTTRLFELCQKNGKSVEVKHWRDGSKSVASVYVDGYHVASSASSQKGTARIGAVEGALDKLQYLKSGIQSMDEDYLLVNDEGEIEGAKQKLHEIVERKRLRKAVYRVVSQSGPSHCKKFISSVNIETPRGVFSIEGNMKSKVKDAENSAASMMLLRIYESWSVK